MNNSINKELKYIYREIVQMGCLSAKQAQPIKGAAPPI
jgi:hypothetical protein